MSKAAIPIVIGLGAGIVALVLLTRKAEAAPPPPPPPAAEIPTAEDIMGAQSTQELNAYYNLIGELYIIGKISPEDYMALYEIYRARFYELVGGAE